MVLKAPYVPGTLLDTHNTKMIQSCYLPSRSHCVTTKGEVMSPCGLIRAGISDGARRTGQAKERENVHKGEKRNVNIEIRQR